jgi:hypothetical protein
MPPASHDLNLLLTQLEMAKSAYEPRQAASIGKLLGEIARHPIDDPKQLIRFHECLLFLRAFPQSASVVRRVEHLLNNVHRRIVRLRDRRADMSVFDDFETSGIACTTMQDTLSFDVARWLVHRFPRSVDIAWDDYWNDFESERARGTTWPRFIPLLEEDADVEASIPWMRWLDAARGRENAPSWLIRSFERLPLTARQRSEFYDSIRLPLRWRLENQTFTRTRNWSRPRRFYFHTSPLIQRSEVLLARELAQPAPKLQKRSRAEGEAVLNAVREVMLVRYRELYGTTLSDPRTVVRADLGRGVVMHFWGLPPDCRLPLRAYVAGYTLKNGVPINYVEAIGLCEWMEVGFNTFYTYRQGETAWIYAQALRCICALTGATCISIYPYQIGQNNDEALDSGAFWFYRKLGFRPGRADLMKLCEGEEKKIAVNPKYRTPRRTLKRLAEAHMFYELEKINQRDDETASRVNARRGRGPWDTFSTRNMALRVNRRMARDFNGDSERIRHASTVSVARALNLDLTNWSRIEQAAFENWSLVLALIPDLTRWAPAEKQQLIDIIRSKSAASEMPYLRLTQRHARLRAALLKLGS